jgi:hypothetical protein
LKAQTFFLWVVYLLSVENLWVELFRKLELAQWVFVILMELV